MQYLLLLFIAVATSASAAPQPTAPEHPSFQMDVQAKRKLVEKAAHIRSGDSYQSVIKKLGKPTHDEMATPKENNRVIGRTLSYYAVIWEKDLVNETGDELVAVYLDAHDRVESVYIRVTLE